MVDESITEIVHGIYDQSYTPITDKSERQPRATCGRSSWTGDGKRVQPVERQYVYAQGMHSGLLLADLHGTLFLLIDCLRL